MIDWLDDMPAGALDQDGKWLDKDELLAAFLYCVKETPWLDWLLLTKRPEDFRPRLLAAMQVGNGNDPAVSETRLWIKDWLDGKAPPNVWIGVSAEDQERADARCNELMTIPATIRFVSAEPLLGPADFEKWLTPDKCGCTGLDPAYANCIDWIIVGGESGPGCRVCRLDWIKNIVWKCGRAKVKVFVKQLGGHLTDGDLDECIRASGRSMHDPKGGDPLEWPMVLRVREMPSENTALLAHLKRTRQFTEEGFAGVDGKTGMIVDRRRHPDAIPIPANRLLGVPKPKKLPNSTRKCDQ